MRLLFGFGSGVLAVDTVPELALLLEEWGRCLPRIADRTEQAIYASLRVTVLREQTSGPEDTLRKVLEHGPIEVFSHLEGELLVAGPGFRAWVSASEAHLAISPTVDLQLLLGGALPITLALLLRERHLFHFHAALVALPGFGEVLITGRSGAGKSTTTLALVEGGAGWSADDAVFVGVDELVGFSRPFHVGRFAMSHLPRWSEAKALRQVGDKFAIDPRDVGLPESVTTGALRGVLCLRAGHASETKLGHITQSQVFAELLLSSAWAMKPLPEKRAHLALLEELGRLPARTMTPGPDLLELPDVWVNRLVESFAS